ncbi:ABC transporter permease, partial [Streptomyces spiralis]
MPEPPPQPQPQPNEPEGAVAGTGMGGGMDLAASEASTLEPASHGPDGPAGSAATGAPGPQDRPRSLWSDAWRDLRRNPVFLLSALVICFLVLIAVWPSLIAPGNPLRCDLARAQDGPRPGH